MINKKIVIATGGTGGHIFPALSLYEQFEKKDFSIIISSDKRGSLFIDNSLKPKVKILEASNFSGKNKIFAFLKIVYSIIQSIFFLIKERPKFIFGMGGYASFPVCFAAIILKKPFFLYENNLVIGKANKLLLPFSKRIYLAYQNVEGINSKYIKKISFVGNILRKEILNYEKKINEVQKDKINILVLGGSQAAKVFAEALPNVFIKCKKEKIDLKIFQQCIKSQNDYLKKIYEKFNIENEIFNFSFNITDYYHITDLVISRAGSSTLSELLHCNIPIVSIPLKSAADNHQEKNAKYFEKNGYCININEEEIDIKLFNFIKLAHKDNSVLREIVQKQKNHKTHFVFDKLYEEIKNLFYEN